MDISLPIDHIGVVCRDVVCTRKSFVDAGFSVTPIDVIHTGTVQQESVHNCHVYLQNSYVELIGDNASYLADFRVTAPGMHILVLRSTDLSIVAERMRTAGIECSDCYHAERPALGATAKFDWLKIETPLIPHMLVAVVHHLTPELIFPENGTFHRNGVSILKRIELAYLEHDALDHNILSKVSECLNGTQHASRSYPSLCLHRSRQVDRMGCCRLVFEENGKEGLISERLGVVY